MKHNRGDVLVILPTEDVLREYEPSELLLHHVDLTLKVLGEAVMEQWIQSERHWGNSNHPAVLSSYDILFTALYPDVIGDEDVCKLDWEDRRALERLIKTFCADFYLTTAPLLEGFSLNEHQLANLDIAWLGLSLVVRIPY